MRLTRPATRVLGGGLSVSALALALLVAPAAVPAPAAPAATGDVLRPISPSTPASAPTWLRRVNLHRAQAGLPALRESRRLSRASRNHARYMRRTGDFSHGERAGSPYRTRSGARAGQRGLISFGRKPAGAVSSWMRGPFHALTLLRADVTRVGLGRSGRYVTLAVNGGLTDIGGRDLNWPGDGVRTSLRSAVPEFPDPRSGCGPAWRAKDPSRLGLPIITTWKRVPADVTAEVRRGGSDVPVCVLSGASAGVSDVARMVLRNHRAVVLFPLDRLERGHTYSARVRAGGATRAWAFAAS